MAEDICQFAGSKRCTKSVSDTFEDHGIPLGLCKRHANMRRRLTIEPKNIDMNMYIDKRLTNVVDCCGRTREWCEPCRRETYYEIGGRYFCALHGQRYPKQKAKLIIKGENDRQTQFYVDIDKRLAKIEKNVDQFVGKFDHLLGFKEFRDTIYAIQEKVEPESMQRRNASPGS